MELNKERLYELTDKIIEWGKEKGIIDGFGTVEGQKRKTGEEIHELRMAIIKGDTEEIIDAIGDVYVTIVLGIMLERGTLGVVYMKRVFFNKNHVEHVEMLSYLTEMLLSSSYISVTNSLIHTLLAVSRIYGLNFLDCVESAYNVISKRTGKMVNGVFVKDSE